MLMLLWYVHYSNRIPLCLLAQEHNLFLSSHFNGKYSKIRNLCTTRINLLAFQFKLCLIATYIYIYIFSKHPSWQDSTGILCWLCLSIGYHHVVAAMEKYMNICKNYNLPINFPLRRPKIILKSLTKVVFFFSPHNKSHACKARINLQSFLWNNSNILHDGAVAFKGLEESLRMNCLRSMS